MSGENPRVVLYGEGVLDTGGESAYLPTPLDPLAGEHLGAAHILVRRALANARKIPHAAVQFLSPKRLRNGRPARGSDLLDRVTLRQLLAFPSEPRRPTLAVVLVDQDGKVGRGAEIERHVDGLMVSRVVGVAVEEFEAWLIADDVRVGDVSGVASGTSPAPESLPPRAAKKHLDRALEQAGLDRLDARRRIAEACDLARLRERCPAFAEFSKRLAVA